MSLLNQHTLSFSRLPIQDLVIESKDDLRQVVYHLLSPLEPHFSKGCARLKLGNTGTNYSSIGADLEALLRVLWGVASLLAGGGTHPIVEKLQYGIQNGTDPNHPEYWGEVVDYDQRAVEMAALSFAIALCPKHFWTEFSPYVKRNISRWLYQVNNVKLPENNWLYFRVLTNVCLKKIGESYDKKMLDADLIKIESLYLGNGWYNDGIPSRGLRRDYYIPTAFHFYGLLYAIFMETEDPDRVKIFRERAALFSKDFMYWFGENGSALHFGRSLTYRFAQGAFWGALAFANVDVFPWGVVKGIMLRNIRWWLKKSIFTESGLLSIGYGYPNLFMSEQYNSYGSPYWAMKFFLPLALDNDDIFWKTQEQPLPKLESITSQPHPFFVICRDKETHHVFALSGGQYPQIDLRHRAEKYSKFVYSSHFSFSVPTERVGFDFIACDSMLALSDDKECFKIREECLEVKIENNVHYSRWKPWNDVTVETWLIPILPWHVRIHHILTERTLISCEGGFAIGRMGEENISLDKSDITEEAASYVSNSNGISGIVNLIGDRKSKLVAELPNSNLLECKTVVPVLFGKLLKTENWLVCAVLGSPVNIHNEIYWYQKPKIAVESNSLNIINGINDVTVYRQLLK
jgi:hypothetical protein